MITLNEVVRELNQLTPDQIAARLESLEIKGEQQKACTCPIAQYLSKIFPDNEPWVYTDHVIVGDQSVMFYDERDAADDYTPLEKFIVRFDNGYYKYKGLIDDETEV